MLIIDNTQIARRFCEISYGTVFKKECEGAKPDYCMKVSTILDQSTQEQYNAINLEDGSWCYFGAYEEVYPYEATLQLEL
jgi:hypothetical protein